MNNFLENAAQILDNLGASLLEWARPTGNIISPLSSWPLAGGFSTPAFIAIGYLCFVFFGSIIMQFLPPCPGLYPFKFIYNIVQVMLCSYMCIESVVRAYSAGYTLLPCNNFDQTSPPLGFILYVFYISKILDFLDTVFIILEKKWGQLSFLHVYHHTSIFLMYWLNVNVGYDGDVYLTIFLNGFIHTIMYTYYFVSLHVKQIWWKSALTLSQMTQFVLMNAQAIYLLYIGCQQYPVKIITVYLYYIVSLLILFANFFVASYVIKGGKGKKSKTA